MSVAANFVCPNCEQPLSASYEDIGKKMVCSNCETEFTIPNFLKSRMMSKAVSLDSQISDEEMAATQQANSPVFDTFTPNQLQLLEAEDEECLRPLRNLRCRNRWELGIMATLLVRRLIPLKQVIFDTPHEQILQSGWISNKAKYNQFIRDYSVEYFKIINSLQTHLAGPFNKTLTGEKLDDLFFVANQMYTIFNQLISSYEQAYQESIPKEEQYSMIQTVMVGWHAEVCQTFLLLIDKLFEGYLALRDNQFIVPQISVSPTNLRTFMTLCHQVGVGFQKPKTVVISTFK